MSYISQHIAAQFDRAVQRLGSDIQWYRFDSSTPRNAYGENLGTKYLPPVTLRCIYKDSPARAELEEYGFNISTEVVFKIPTPQLDTPSPQINDKIVLNGIAYFITQVGSGGHINNDSVFLTYACERNVYTNGK
jgi:hypothetical protein